MLVKIDRKICISFTIFASSLGSEKLSKFRGLLEKCNLLKFIAMKPIYTLIIESSTTMPAVALSCNGQIQSQLNLTPGFSSSQELIPKLMDLLAGENVQVSDISYIGVGVGPGSYTGIRVGVSVAQCLAYALSLPLCGICSLKAFVPS